MVARGVGVALVAVAAGAGAFGGDPAEVYGPGELPASFTRTDPGVATLVFVGDIMPWDRAADLVRREGPGWPFAATEPLLRGADVAVGNLEGPVSEALERTDGQYRYRIPPFTLRGIREAGIDLLGLANNHLMDCGEDGLTETLWRLQEAGVRSFGAGRNAEEAGRPIVVDVAGTRVAFIGAVCPETALPDAVGDSEEEARAGESSIRSMCQRVGASVTMPGTTLATPEAVLAMVQRASANADLVVACLHFGIRYVRPPTARQRLLAHAAVDGGADLVVGHHAHFWQPVEVYRGVPIFYGLGNFTFGSGNRRADAGLLLRAAVAQARVAAVEVFPLYTLNRDPVVNYQPKVLREAGAARVIAELAEHSAALGATLVFQEGRGRLTVGNTETARDGLR